MKLANNNVLLFALTTSLASAQECINGGWAIEFEGSCNYENVLEAYTHQGKYLRAEQWEVSCYIMYP